MPMGDFAFGEKVITGDCHRALHQYMMLVCSTTGGGHSDQFVKVMSAESVFEINKSFLAGPCGYLDTINSLSQLISASIQLPDLSLLLWTKW